MYSYLGRDPLHPESGPPNPNLAPNSLCRVFRSQQLHVHMQLDKQAKQKQDVRHQPHRIEYEARAKAALEPGEPIK